MSGLAFRTIRTGFIGLGEGEDDGADRFDLFQINIDLPGFVDEPALLFLVARGVEFDKNFVTVNPPSSVTSQSHEEAKDDAHFVGRFLPNQSNIWIPQYLPITIGKLKIENNTLAIHTRNTDGASSGERDNFGVGRIILFYAVS